ncbi:MAG: TRAP transporter small permease subunit [Myxococcota bacterium]
MSATPTSSADSPSSAAPEGIWLRLDAVIFRVERAAVVAATGVMTLAVFLAVVWRMMAAPVGRIETLLVAVTGSDTPAVHAVAQGITFSVWLVICVFAARTARKAWAWPRVVAVGAGVAVGSLLLSWLFVWAVPEGVVFSQRLALCLMMWVVFLGSSMAAHTRRHIFLQAAQKLVPEKLLRAHAALGLLIAAGFTLFLVVVSTSYAWNNLQDWIATDFQAAIFDSVPIPHWTVTASVPVGLGMTAVRFVGQAVAIWTGHMPPVPASSEEQLAAQEESLTARETE